MSGNSARPSRQRLRANQRLRSAADFNRVYDARASASDEQLLVYGRANETGQSRLGVSVSHKVGGAVMRNRWKRVLREAFRTNQDVLPTGIDFILIPRRGAEPELAPIVNSLTVLARRVARRLEQGRKKRDQSS